MSFRFFLISMFLFVSCKNSPERGLSSETTINPKATMPDNFDLTILPRPTDVATPDFSGPENNLCYNYANLLVRNGLAQADESWYQESQTFLNSQNNDFNSPVGRELLNRVYNHGTIVIHHTAGTGSASDVINYHMLPQDSSGRGFSDTGYHFLIEQDGDIVTGRSLAQMGAHVMQIPNRTQDCANNRYYMDLDPDYRSIGIALIGHYYHRSTPPPAQINSLRRLIQSLRERFNITEVVRHRDLKNTACPGSIGELQGIYSEPSEETIRARQNSDSPYRIPDRRLICYSCQ